MATATRGETQGLPKAKNLTGFCGGSSYPTRQKDGSTTQVWVSFGPESHAACPGWDCDCTCHEEA